MLGFMDLSASLSGTSYAGLFKEQNDSRQDRGIEIRQEGRDGKSEGGMESVQGTIQNPPPSNVCFDLTNYLHVRCYGSPSTLKRLPRSHKFLVCQAL